jgi:peptidyl-prolyl cis-trans isomerase D
LVADLQNRSFFVVKVNKVVPGNALLQPGLIGRMQNELQQASVQDYAAQFVTAVRAEMKVKRNDKAINAQKQRMATGSGI